MTAKLDHEAADLRRQLDEARAERDEAEAQKAAMAEVLGIINSSPGDLAPVFDIILKKAHDLCGAEVGVLLSYDGQCYWPFAAQHTSGRFLEHIREGFRPGVNNPFARVLRGEPFVQIPNIVEFLAQGIDDPELRIAVEMGIRTFVVVPLLKDGNCIGAISANRRTVRPLTDKQLGLLQSFAAQAVLAMENARLITETRESLEKQTATAEILRVISASPTDLQPTFDAIAARATTLCGAVSGGVFRFDDSLIYFAAHYGWDQEELRATRTVYPMRPGQGSITARAIMNRQVAHAADVSGDPSVQPIVEQAFRTVLSVPMLHDGVALGAITVTRRQVEPFTDAQIELLKTFADQAVIAIENVRLFTELGDALEQQPATAEVLGVINASPGDLAPVFDAMLKQAMRHREGVEDGLNVYDGERFCPMVALGVPKMVEWLRQRGPVRPGSGTTMERIARGEGVIHISDVRDDVAYQRGDPTRRALVDIGGCRTLLSIGLRKDNVVLGVITVYRQEVSPFSDKQVALLQNFAAQAVIAIENTLLITETREALDQQTATAEVLRVINAAPGCVREVLKTFLERPR